MGDTLSVDVKDLKLYQQLFIYFVPIASNIAFINILVIVVRLYWFEKRLKQIGSYFSLWALGVVSKVTNAMTFKSSRRP